MSSKKSLRNVISEKSESLKVKSEKKNVINDIDSPETGQRTPIDEVS